MFRFVKLAVQVRETRILRFRRKERPSKPVRICECFVAIDAGNNRFEHALRSV